MDVLHRLMMQLSEAGETERAIETGEQILRLDPLHEGAVRRLMRLYAESGRRSTAIQLYRTLSDALKSDLDAQPEAETRALFAEITRGDETAGASGRRYCRAGRSDYHRTSTRACSCAPRSPDTGGSAIEVGRAKLDRRECVSRPRWRLFWRMH